jgi:hypothetical protein
VLVAILSKPDVIVPVTIVIGIGWLVVMNALQPRIMATSLRIHPIVVLGSVLVGLKVAGIPGAIFGIPIAAVVSALFLHFLSRNRQTGPVAARAAARVGRREGRAVRQPREPNPMTDRDVEGVASPAAEVPDSGVAAIGDAVGEVTGTKGSSGSASNFPKPAKP